MQRFVTRLRYPAHHKPRPQPPVVFSMGKIRIPPGLITESANATAQESTDANQNQPPHAQGHRATHLSEGSSNTIEQQTIGAIDQEMTDSTFPQNESADANHQQPPKTEEQDSTDPAVESIDATDKQPASPLLALPTELILSIINHTEPISRIPLFLSCRFFLSLSPSFDVPIIPPPSAGLDPGYTHRAADEDKKLAARLKLLQQLHIGAWLDKDDMKRGYDLCEKCVMLRPCREEFWLTWAKKIQKDEAEREVKAGEQAEAEALAMTTTMTDNLRAPRVDTGTPTPNANIFMDINMDTDEDDDDNDDAMPGFIANANPNHNHHHHPRSLADDDAVLFMNLSAPAIPRHETQSESENKTEEKALLHLFDTDAWKNMIAMFCTTSHAVCPRCEARRFIRSREGLDLLRVLRGGLGHAQEKLVREAEFWYRERNPGLD